MGTNGHFSLTVNKTDGISRAYNEVVENVISAGQAEVSEIEGNN